MPLKLNAEFDLPFLSFVFETPPIFVPWLLYLELSFEVPSIDIQRTKPEVSHGGTIAHVSSIKRIHTEPFGLPLTC